MTSKAKDVFWYKNAEKNSDESINKNADKISDDHNENNHVKGIDDQKTSSEANDSISPSMPSVSSSADEKHIPKNIEKLSPRSQSEVSSSKVDVSNQHDKHSKKSSALTQLADSATMFDLIFKLYSMLLGHSVRKGGERSFNAIGQAASLQRICLNGNAVIGVLLSNLISEHTINGTVHDIENFCPKKMKVSGERHRFLKMSARVVTTAILTNGAEGIDMTSAVRQWRSLRHLTAVSVAVTFKCG